MHPTPHARPKAFAPRRPRPFGGVRGGIAFLVAMAIHAAVAGAAEPAARAAAPEPAADPARDTIVETQLLSRGAKAHLAQRQSALAAPRASRGRIDVARELIRTSRATGDPRLLGYAEAELAALPADDGGDAATDALVLRATIEQAHHRFDAARRLLDAALAGRHDHVQALITRATVLLVQGRIASARADCERLAAVAPDAAALCGASVDAASGGNARALAATDAVARHGHPSLRGWALSVAAEVHEMDGNPPGALRLYAASLAAGDDLYTRIALAEALLGVAQPRAAQAVLAGAAPSDGVLLQRWRAARALGDRDTAALEAQLATRFDVDAARGAPLHLREAAWFALERGDATTALRLATANWAAQRTAADALLLARAAAAARDRGQQQVVRDWLQATGLKDARIRGILAEARREARGVHP